MDSPVIWLVLKLDHVASLPLKISGTSTKSSLLLIPSHLSHSGRNSARWPFWPVTPSGTLDRNLPGALKINRCSAPDFPSSWRCPSAFAGFISEFLYLSPAVVVLYVFVCVQPCVEASPWLSSRPGLKCTSFCHAFCSCCMQCLNKGWYNTTTGYSKAVIGMVQTHYNSLDTDTWIGDHYYLLLNHGSRIRVQLSRK